MVREGLCPGGWGVGGGGVIGLTELPGRRDVGTTSRSHRPSQWVGGREGRREGGREGERDGGARERGGDREGGCSAAQR